MIQVLKTNTKGDNFTLSTTNICYNILIYEENKFHINSCTLDKTKKINIYIYHQKCFETVFKIQKYLTAVMMLLVSKKHLTL